MDTVAVKFGVALLVLGLLAFAILVAVWGGVGPCTDIRQIILLFLAVTGILIGGGVLILSLPMVVVRRYKKIK
jgi:hypothetical protein